MKTVSMMAVAAVLVLGQTTARGDDKAAPGGGDLKALDAKLTEAFKNRDVKLLEQHTADGALIIDPLGRVHHKKEYFAHLEKSEMKIADLKESDVKVRMFGDTAIVTGLLTLKAMVKDRDLSGDYRWTRVYHKKGGEWQVVSEQHTYVLPKDAAK